MRVGGVELGSRTPSAVVRPPASAWRTAGCTQSMLLSCSDFMSALELVMRRPVCGLWRARSGAFKASKSKGGAKTCRVLNHGLHARMMWSGLHVHVVSIDAAVANFRQQAVRPGHVGSEGIGEHAKGAALRTHQVKKHGWTCDVMRSWPFSRLGQALSGHSRDAVQASLITRLLHPNMHPSWEPPSGMQCRGARHCSRPAHTARKTRRTWRCWVSRCFFTAEHVLGCANSTKP